MEVLVNYLSYVSKIITVSFRTIINWHMELLVLVEAKGGSSNALG